MDFFKRMMDKILKARNLYVDSPAFCTPQMTSQGIGATLFI